MFKEVSGLNEDNKGVSHSYIWALPKSGTVLCNIYFAYYSGLVNGSSDDISDYKYPACKDNMFGKEDFRVEHSACPGFLLTDLKAEEKSKWDELSYYTSGWSGDGPRKSFLFSEMQKGGDLNWMKVVFIYRNPLDQLISYHRHQLNSFTDDHPYKSGFNGSNISLNDFIFQEGALGSYVKMFYTYKKVAEKFPGLVLFVPYEKLVTEREQTFKKMMLHLGIDIFEKSFKKCIEDTSLNRMKELENRIGGSIGGDQTSPEERHIRNGSIGAWQKKITKDEVLEIEKFMNSFDLSLKDFYLADSFNEEFSFLNES